MADARPTSLLIVDELFATGSPDFLPALRSVADPAALAPFAERWLRDPRPWAREQLLTYLDLPFDAVGHNPLVKRLFKGAEARGDDGLMGACAVAFDRLVRRTRRKRTRWDSAVRRYVPETSLVAPRDTLAARKVTLREWDPRTNRPVKRETVFVSGSRLFSYHTRYYLRRRAWRYFRRKGHQKPTGYVAAVAGFLARYRDADLSAGEHLLDSWSLLHACFGEHEAVSFTAHRARLAAAGSAGLAPAPPFPRLWQAEAAAAELLRLTTAAGARLVRVWAVEAYRLWHAGQPWARGMPLDALEPMLLHADEPVQLLGVELLASAAGLERVPLARWLRLLGAGSLTVLEAVAAAVRRHVDPSAVTLFDAVTMASAPAAPVARLGLHYLRQLPIDTPQRRQALSNVAGLKSAAAADEIIAWVLGVLGPPGAYDVDQVTRFFDSPLPEARAAAWAWLAAAGPSGSPGWDDPTLWTRLLETPHEDLRFRLVDALERRTASFARRGPNAIAGGAVNAAPSPRAPHRLGPAALAPMWTAVLLNIHRGGRRKLTALRQISDAVRSDPASAGVLMPVLAAAIRSVRVPEARAGLAAIVSAVAARPELEAAVGRALPELRLTPTAG